MEAIVVAGRYANYLAVASLAGHGKGLVTHLFASRLAKASTDPGAPTVDYTLRFGVPNTKSACVLRIDSFEHISTDSKGRSDLLYIDATLR